MGADDNGFPSHELDDWIIEGSHGAQGATDGSS